MRRRTDPFREERMRAFAQKLNRLLLEKRWSGTDLAARASEHVPASHKDPKTGKRFVLGRHLISNYSRGVHEPTESNLSYIAKALGVKPEDLMPPAPGDAGSHQYATATSGLDGKTRLVVDAEVEPEVALKILALVRGTADVSPKSTRKKTA